MLALAGLMQLALRVGLRSLDRLTGQVRALDVTSLDTRVAVEAPPEEIAVVVEQVNALLARLEAGFKRERRLSSDIAHELKTPIAELRNLSEVGRPLARGPGLGPAVLRGRRSDRAADGADRRAPPGPGARTTRAGSRSGRRRYGSRRSSTPPGSRWPARPPPRGSSSGRRSRAASGFETDPEKFALMVPNLLSNAVAYSPPGTAVVCASEETAGRASVSFTNRAENLEPQDLAVMFDRFWRKDEARDRRPQRGAGAGARAGAGRPARHRDRDAASCPTGRSASRCRSPSPAEARSEAELHLARARPRRRRSAPERPRRARSSRPPP